uniref:Retrovirus-related Pol polyprotein from transposon TNT 1-94 n=1 Tax=Triticum urartu TaxID=4572 RepID=A0A8R7P947_TRIUA
MLTRTNYPEWSLLMKVYLQAHGWWRAVSHRPYHDEHNAMSIILRGLPTDVLLAVGEKENAKEAWDAIATQRLGATRVREANAQKLQRDFESIAFRDGETIDDFSLRLSGIVSGLRALGDTLEESKVVAKFLRVVQPQFAQVAIAIKTLLDISTLSLDEVTGRLRVVQERLDDTQSSGSSQGGRLLLTWEEWQARQHPGDQAPTPSGSNNCRKGGGRGGGRGGKRGGRRGGDYPDKSGGDKEKCRYCGIKGHWAQECRKKKREEEALLAQADEEADPQMLFAEVVELMHPTEMQTPAGHRRNPPQAAVFLNEEQSGVVPAAEDAAPDPVWYLDTRASNHMTGDRAAFTELDKAITGSVRFGDGSVVQIEGRGTIAFAIDGGAQRALMDMYYIPRLKSSVVSLGQLDENGCDINIHHGVLTIHDRRRVLIAKVKRSPNQFYKLCIRPVRPVCLGASTGSVSWRWHARFGHLHMDALQRMARGEMVCGLPGIEHTGELCQACLAGKQRRAPFPQAAKYRAEAPLDLVHADLCGAITPATPGGRCYFLLLVDDHSRYMWLTLLTSKDEAGAAIKEFQARAETEARRKLGTLRTDRGEYTSTALAKHFAATGVQRHLTAPYSPQQNGVVERRNQTVVGMARSMMKAKGMPDYFWGEAVTTAVYLLNRAFTRSVDGATPYEAWHGRKPEVSHLRVFGCVAHVKSARPLLKKHDDQSTPMVLIGYEPGSKAYRVYDPATRRVHVSRDVVFNENVS